MTRVPHPKAHELVLPDGSPAPAALREWAAFDEEYPTYLAAERSGQKIATAEGVVHAKPMAEVLRDVCIESIRDEIDDDTIEYLEGVVEEFTAELPGYGVRLESFDHPDQVLWLGPEGAICLWYEHDKFERREPFEEWSADKK